MCKFRISLLRKKNHFNRTHFPISGLNRLTISSTLLVGLALNFATGSVAYAQDRTLTVTGSGPSNGIVTGNGINCTITAGSTSGTCSKTFPNNTQIALTATATTGFFSNFTATCGRPPKIVNDIDRFAFTIAENCTVDAKFVTEPHPTIRITKATTNGDGSFNFTIFNALNPANSVALNIPNTAVNSMITPVTAAAGNISVTESDPLGWNLTSSDCLINGIPQGSTFDFNIINGDQVECIFENLLLPPDLEISKANNVGGATTLGKDWIWTITSANSGVSDATFTDTQPIFSDNLPDTDITYGPVTVDNETDITGSGTISCVIVSSNLTCSASGDSVTLGASTGTFDVFFTATPSATGTFVNPHSGKSCSIDPSMLITETDETNNACSDTVTVTAPDLTASKANDVSGATTLGNSWIWTITNANTGNADVTFTDTQTIFSDNLPDDDITYGTVTVDETDITGSGTISCAIVSNDLTCSANGGSVTLGATTGTFDVSFPATPSATGTFVNPHSGKSCSIDPSMLITETDETNNACSDTVTVTEPEIVFRVERSTGNVFASGSFIPNGADLAERINVSEPVEPGDVVELDPSKPGHYRKARGSSQLVAGVITTEPGFTLGNDPEEMEDVDKVTSRSMLALMGRVPVKATTENGPIRPGDLLTVANKPGYATRCAEAEECEGAIIGKALGGLESGEGLILVLVMSP